MALIKLSIALLGLALLASSARADGEFEEFTGPTTTGKRWMGYTFVSDVQGYVNMTMDYESMKAALAAGNISDIYEVYKNGRNAFSGSNPRRYYSWAISNNTGEPYFDSFVAVYKNMSWGDNMVREALAANDGARMLSLIGITIAYKYFAHEIDAGYLKTLKSLNDDASGAPHNVDEAWGLYAGGRQGQTDSFYQWADKLAADMGTSYAGSSPINLVTVAAMNDILHASRTNDSALYASAAKKLFDQHLLFAAQAMIRDAYASNLAANCRTMNTAAAKRSSMLAWWYALAPQLASRKVQSALVDAVVAEATKPQVNFRKVSNAVKAVLLALRMDPQMVGAPVFRSINTSPGCAATNAPRR